MRVTALDRIELRPQNLGLEFQRRDRGILLIARAAAVDDQLKRVLRVAGRLHEAGPEVLEAGGVDPVVVALERLESYSDRGRAEQLRERRRDRLDPRPLPREVHVRVDRVANPGEHAALGLELSPSYSERLAESQPRLDPTRPVGRSIVVDDPLDPLAPDRDLGTVGHDRGVLERYALLVV